MSFPFLNFVFHTDVGEDGGSPRRIQGRDTGGGKGKGTWEVGIPKGREGEEIG